MNLFFLLVPAPLQNYSYCFGLMKMYFALASLRLLRRTHTCGSLHDKRFPSERARRLCHGKIYSNILGQRSVLLVVVQMLRRIWLWGSNGSRSEASYNVHFCARVRSEHDFYILYGSSSTLHPLAHAPWVRLCHFIHKFGLTRDNSIRFGPFSSRAWTRLLYRSRFMHIIHCGSTRFGFGPARETLYKIFAYLEIVWPLMGQWVFDTLCVRCMNSVCRRILGREYIVWSCTSFKIDLLKRAQLKYIIPHQIT